MPPVHPFEQHRQLRRGQHRDAVRGRRPGEPAPLQTLGMEHETLTIPPQQLDQIATLAPEGVHRTAKRILAQPLLYQRGQPVEALAHVRDPGRQIHPDTARRPDQANPASTVLSTRASMGGARRMRCPAGPTTSTTPGPSGSECGTMGAPATSTGMNAGPGNGNASLATPSRSSVRRQRYTNDVHTRCRRATSNTLAPGIIASDTIRALSSSLNRRRGSGPTISIIRVAMMPHRCLPQCRTCGLRITSSARRRRPDAYDAPTAYGSHKTLYNRWKRWAEAGVFTRMMEGLAAKGAEPKTVMIDATYLKAHRTASSLRVKKGILAA